MKWNRQILAFFIAALLLAMANRAPAAVAAPFEYQDVAVDQKPNAQLPLDLTFYDENNHEVALSDYFQSGRPVVLQLGYFDCPKLCDVISRSLVDAAKKMDIKAGTDFNFVFVSINPQESSDLAALKRQSFIEEYGKPDSGSGFHCLVGLPTHIDQLAKAVGFGYKRLALEGQYSHPAVLMVLTPTGRIYRYLFGVTVDPETLKLSLIEAAAGKIGSFADNAILMICSFDVDMGRYAASAVKIMKLGGIVTVLSLGGFVFWLSRYGPRLRMRLEQRDFVK